MVAVSVAGCGVKTARTCAYKVDTIRTPSRLERANFIDYVSRAAGALSIMSPR